MHVFVVCQWLKLYVRNAGKVSQVCRHSVDVILEGVSTLKLFYSKTIIFHCSKKLLWSNTYNQVKTCTKHGKPNEY